MNNSGSRIKKIILDNWFLLPWVLFGVFVVITIVDPTYFGFLNKNQQYQLNSQIQKSRYSSNQELYKWGYKQGHAQGKRDVETDGVYDPEGSYSIVIGVTEWKGKHEIGSDFDVSSIAKNKSFKNGFIAGYKQGWNDNR